ncbi:unnamed protein product [Prorocentrum cordatum]|uniref:Uncharacterized protein n=1 Tax=Prorocentrum cordatum TaxID=2364126 RepID=A0ABN9S3Y2_9DINO|nr:unnamed protein product [Polarella glacialis]
MHRGWRQKADGHHGTSGGHLIGSGAEEALLRAAELQEAMLLVLEQAARLALRPSGADRDRGVDARVASLLRLVAEVERLEYHLARLCRERSPVGPELHDVAVAAASLVLEVEAGTEADARALKLLAAELSELREDQQALAEACGSLRERGESAGHDLDALVEARDEVPKLVASTAVGAAGPGEGALGPETAALDGAGASTRRLLDVLSAGLRALEAEADGLLRYLDASGLLRSRVALGHAGGRAQAPGIAASGLAFVASGLAEVRSRGSQCVEGGARGHVNVRLTHPGQPSGSGAAAAPRTSGGSISSRLSFAPWLAFEARSFSWVAPAGTRDLRVVAELRPPRAGQAHRGGGAALSARCEGTPPGEALVGANGSLLGAGERRPASLGGATWEGPRNTADVFTLVFVTCDWFSWILLHNEQTRGFIDRVWA